MESQPSPPVQRKKKIIIGLPGNRFSNNFLMSWTRLLDVLWKSNFEIIVLCRYASFVTFSRMQTLGLDVRRGPDQKPFGGQVDYDVWLTLDSDMVFNPEDVLELIQNTEIHPVVSGLYLMQNTTNYAAITNWDETYFKQNGSFQFLTPQEVENYRKETGQKFMEVVYNGMGFFACRAGVIERLKYPYFYRELQEIKDDNGNVIMRDMCSEDVAFCKNLKDAGFSVIVNTNLRVGHEKSFVI
jgi:hypothetical protein